jgi:formylglycine-generating enzyme required for sulfatase activity
MLMPLKIFLILFTLSVMLSSPANADSKERAIKNLTSQNIERRVAIVIGNSDYSFSPLKNPVNDAKSVTKALKRLNFKVYDYYNLSREDIMRAVNRFTESENRGGTALFFYAGHGVQSNGNNYLVPINSNIKTETDIEFESVNMNRVIGKMNEAGNRVNIVIMDACRNNPFESKYRSVSGGLATVDAPIGSFIAYATAPGSVAADGDDENGVFTKAFINVLENTKGITIEKAFKLIRSSVRQATEGKQIPWTSSSMEGDFFFSPSEKSLVNIQQPQLKTPASKKSNSNTTYTENYTGMKFVKVPAGCFKMGSYPNERSISADETPLHRVCLGEYYIGAYEVTQNQWQKITGINPSHFNGCGECPVENISWEDAQYFIEKLNRKTGKNFRLPTEAEWEFAARDAGQIKLSPSDLSPYAWFSKNSFGKTHEVGKKLPNKLGIYDMLGNVQEWCEDFYESSYYSFSSLNNPKGPQNGTRRVLRGGSWGESSSKVRLTNRRQGYQDSSRPFIGFRLVFTN